jgi:very-short-patch-repair endonuclease
MRRLLSDLVPPSATRSELEERFLELVRQAGLPPPAVNAVVAGLEVDAFWPAQRLVVELDGYAHHRGRVSFERDHERELILAAAGFERLRFTWSMVVRNGPRTVSLVRATLSRRSRPLGELNTDMGG